MTPHELAAYQSKLNMTNVQLAARLRVAPETLARWRNGKQPIPADLDTRLQAAIASPPAPLGHAHPLAVAYWYTLEGELLDRAALDQLPVGAMYWEYLWGAMCRRTRAYHGISRSDGYDGICVPAEWCHIDVPHGTPAWVYDHAHYAVDLVLL